MTGRVRNGTAARDSHILSLRLVIVVLGFVCLLMWNGWKTAPDSLTVHNPPDLRSGSTRAWWDINPSNVYAFSFYIWQQLNRWETDGSKNYKDNIFSLSPYFTASCKIFLEADFEERLLKGEIKGRTRHVQEIPGRGYKSGSIKNGGSVDVLSNDSWLSNLDLAVVEEYGGLPVRDIYVRYPLKIIRADVDPESNEWGLQIACFEGKPQKIYKPDQAEE